MTFPENATPPRPDPTPPVSIWRALPIALVLVCGIVFSGAAFVVVRAQEQARVEQRFDWRARSQAQTLQGSIRGFEECLYALRALYDSSDYVSALEFQTISMDLRARHPGIQMLQWIPRVRHADRAKFEEDARRQVDPQFVIHLGVHEGDDAAKPFVPSEDRIEYLPTEYVEPMAIHKASVGFDHSRGPHQRAIARAVEEDGLAGTHRIKLRDAADGEFGWVVFLPVFDLNAKPQTRGERREKLRGFIAGTFRLNHLVTGSDTDLAEGGADLLLSDQTPGGTEPYLVSLVGGQLRTSPPPSIESFGTGMSRAIPFDVAGRSWVAHFRPAPGWLARQTTGYPLAFLIGGLWLTVLLTALLFSAQRRTQSVERIVRQRTAELHATEEKLREDVKHRVQAEERYRTLVEQSTEAIWRYELEVPLRIDLPEDVQLEHLYQHAVLAECNDATAKMYGYATAAELVGTRLSKLLPRDDPANTAHLLDYIRQKFRVADSESHEIDRHGKPRVFLNNLIGIIEHGYLLRSWGTQRDITGQRAAEEARRENELRLRLALNAADMGTWEWDIKDGGVTISDGLFNIMGRDPATFEATSSGGISLVHPDDRERTRDTVRKALADQPDFEFEFRIVRPDGTERWLDTRGEIWRDAAGKPVRMLGAAIDITDRKRAEEERVQIDRRLQETQKLESLGILAGGIAHDFNNLLTGILGNASLARMDLPPNSPVQPCLAAIETTSQRAAELCKQMLAYSGKGRFVVQRLDLNELVEDTAHLVQLSISKSAVLKFNMGHGLPAISADATQMRQIIMNLVINASDALGERSGVISISTGLMHADRAYLSDTHLSPDLPEGDYVFLEISDNGCGMSPETRDRIFDPFFTTKFTGRGLGLAAVLGIVRGHSGSMKVYSEVDRGTTFKLLLPCADGPAEAMLKPTDTSPWRGSGTVLVVDDEETVRLVAARMLEIMGFDVVTATHGIEGVEKFQADPSRFIAVLLDLTMPQMDGSATFTELRRINPAVKVLLMSGFNEQDAINRFAGKGLAGFLQKPFKPDALRGKLRAMLEGAA